MRRYLKSESARNEKHRAYIEKRWLPKLGDSYHNDSVLWVMLNPSIADGTRDDATVRRCVGFSERLGFGAMEIVNLFTYIATKQKDLYDLMPMHRNCPNADRFIVSACERNDYAIFAYGGIAEHHSVAVTKRVREVKALVTLEKYCLGRTRDGWPRHPSRLPYDIQLEEYND